MQLCGMVLGPALGCLRPAPILVTFENASSFPNLLIPRLLSSVVYTPLLGGQQDFLLAGLEMAKSIQAHVEWLSKGDLSSAPQNQERPLRSQGMFTWLERERPGSWDLGPAPLSWQRAFCSFTTRWGCPGDPC